MMPSKDRVLGDLKARGIDVRQMASSPEVFDRCCSLVYRAVPIPLRWLVGKRRIRLLLAEIRGSIIDPTVKRDEGRRITTRIARRP